MPRVGGAAAAADLAVVAHVFYHDLWDEIADRLAAAGIPFDLYVTITDKGGETDALVPRIRERFPNARTLRYPEPRPRRAALRPPRQRRGRSTATRRSARSTPSARRTATTATTGGGT